MKLIGMYGSPFVRRVAIVLRLFQLPFEHHGVSVFGGLDKFRLINPVAKAPTLICDDGTILMDSNLIIEYLETLRVPLDGPGTSSGHARTALSFRVIGLALAACEKTGQLIYERTQRPPSKQHEPWLTRVGTQLLAACEGMEAELSNRALATEVSLDSLARITSAVAWTFAQVHAPHIVKQAEFPNICSLARQMEGTAEFLAVPVS